MTVGWVERCRGRKTLYDGGNTWSKAVSSGLPNPNSKFHLMRLSDGTLALAYNHHNRARTNLFVALSKDGGDTWHLAARVEDGSGEEAGASVSHTRIRILALLYLEA